MIDPSVAEIATALREIGFPPRFRDDELRLLNRVLRYVAEGHPVSPRHIEQVAALDEKATDLQQDGQTVMFVAAAAR